MIRSDNEQLAQVQGENMLLIMYCWNYVRRSWYMKILILLDPNSFFDLGDSSDDGNLQVVDPDVADRC